MQNEEHLIAVGQYRLRARTQGASGPVVVFDAGHGDGADQWGDLPGEIAAFARVCTYDRAGRGGSSPAPLPRTSGQIVADLRTVLAALALPPPYILVGHSFGGQNMTLFARCYPAEVAGLILFDATHHDFAERMRAILTLETWATFAAEFDQSVEGIDRHASSAELRAAPPFPPIPLVVVARGVLPATDQHPPGWPIAQFEAMWQGLQAEQAAQSPRGRLIRADGAGHYVHHDRPDLALAAIRAVTDEVAINLDTLIP